MMNAGSDPKIVQGIMLLLMTVCVCCFLAFAFCGFYTALRAECFSGIQPWLDFMLKTAVGVSGCYLGVKLVGVKGLSVIAEALRHDEEPENPFAGMFD